MWLKKWLRDNYTAFMIWGIRNYDICTHVMFEIVENVIDQWVGFCFLFYEYF